jgi:hypothetical protein
VVGLPRWWRIRGLRASAESRRGFVLARAQDHEVVVCPGLPSSLAVQTEITLIATTPNLLKLKGAIAHG